MAGTINVDIDALQTLVQNLQFLKNNLDEEKGLVPSLTTQLNTAITGTAHSIAAFEHKFSDWIHLMNTLTTDIDTAYTALHAVLTDAKVAAHSL